MSRENLLHTDVIYLQKSEREAAAGGQVLRALADRFKIEAIAIGNGTADVRPNSLLKPWICRLRLQSLW